MRKQIGRQSVYLHDGKLLICSTPEWHCRNISARDLSILEDSVSGYWKNELQKRHVNICNKGHLRARNNSANCLQNIAKSDLCSVLLIGRNLFNSSFHGIFVHK